MSRVFETNIGGELGALADQLKGLYAKSLPFAVRQAVDKTAFEARKEWVRNAGEAFTLRNTWTTRNMIVRKASRSERDVGKIVAIVGTPLEYLAQQEEGFTRTKKGKYGVPIPTPIAAGQAEGAQRTKLVRRRHYMGAMALRRRVAGGRDRKNVVSVIMALKTGTRLAFMDLRGGRRGIFRVNGSKKKWELKMVWDLSNPSVRVPAHPTLGPASDTAGRRLPRYLETTMQQQIARQIARKKQRAVKK